MRYDPNNSRKLVSAIDTLLADEEERLGMAARCRELYRSRFTYEFVYGNLVRHLEHLATLGQSRAR